jgi:hypothetical protein
MFMDWLAQFFPSWYTSLMKIPAKNFNRQDYTKIYMERQRNQISLNIFEKE